MKFNKLDMSNPAITKSNNVGYKLHKISLKFNCFMAIPCNMIKRFIMIKV